MNPLSSRAFRLVPLVIGLAAPVLAQFQLVVPEGDIERPVTTQFDFGSVPTRDYRDVRFRARNLSSFPAAIDLLSLGGAGFTPLNPPQLPHTVESGGFLDFVVRFQPVAPGLFSATLRLNTLSPIIRGTGIAAPELVLEEPGGRVALTSASVLDFGEVERGSVAARRLVLENHSGESLSVQKLAVSGEEYRLDAAASLPLSLEPGESLAFDLLFEPQTAGPKPGYLEIDLRRVALAGTAVAPPLPRPVIVFDPTSPSSAQQVKIGIQLAEASPTSGTGRLSVEFHPDIEGYPRDPAILFVNTGGQDASFTVAEGGSAAKFGSLDEIVLQTGTTAGRLVIRAELGAYAEEDVLMIAPAPPGIDTVRASRSANGLEIYIAAFDNTRSAAQLSFTFFDLGGRAVQPGAIRLDARNEFQDYFQASEAGGSFSLRAVFPVSGDQSRLAGVEVEITNSAGTAKTGRIAF